MVLKLDKSNDFNPEHPLNIPIIVVTFDVSNLEKFISFMLLHSKKRQFKFVTSPFQINSMILFDLVNEYSFIGKSSSASFIRTSSGKVGNYMQFSYKPILK